MKKNITVNSLLTLIILFFGYISAPNLNPLYPDGAFTWLVIISIYIAVNTISNFKLFNMASMANGSPVLQLNKNVKFKKWGLILIICFWALYFLTTLISTPLFFSDTYKKQMPEPEEQAFSSDMSMVDLTQVPIVDKELATKLADKKLGEKPSLGSQVKLGEPTIQKVNGKLIWVVPLYHSGFFKWFTNMDGSDGYITVSATNIQDINYIDKFKIKIQPNAYFNDDLNRYARFSKGWVKGLTDYSFELDESGQPYWAITTYKNIAGFSLPEADGVLLINATNGNTSNYSLDKIPAWVDRIQPEEFIMSQIDNKGNFVHGIFNFSNKDKFQTSQGHSIIYNNDRCYLFTGITSVGADQSAIGFYMVDLKTKKPKLYKMSGATESAAMSSAEGNVQDLGYKASFPIILNVAQHPTYFMTLKDNEGLIKQYAFASIKDYSIVGNASTIGEAMKNFEKALSSTSSGAKLIDTNKILKIEGTVDRIGSSIENGNTVYTLSIIEKPGILYRINGDKNESLSITKPQDSISIEYDKEDKVINVISFTNKTIGK